jgi:hypothetical protein
MERILAALRPRWRAPLKAKPVRHARRPSIGSYPSRIRTGRARAFELRSGKRKGNPKRRARMKESPRPGRETNARRATTPCGLRRKGPLLAPARRNRRFASCASDEGQPGSGILTRHATAQRLLDPAQQAVQSGHPEFRRRAAATNPRARTPARSAPSPL